MESRHRRRRSTSTGTIEHKLGHWLGMPDLDLWLVWVGAPYRPMVPAEAVIHREFDDAVLLKLGPSPLALGELRCNRIDWPLELRRRGDHLQEEAAAKVIPDLRR